MSTPTLDRQAPYVRLTILGTRRNADLVLPTREPLHLLLPSVLDLLGEPDQLAEYELATIGGRSLDMACPLGETDVEDGQLLRLTPTTEAPSDPEVYDVVETARTYADTTPGLWDHRTRPVGAAIAAAGMLAAAGLVWVRTAAIPSPATLITLAITATLLVVLAAVLEQRPSAWLAWAVGTALAIGGLRTGDHPTAAVVATLAAVVAVAGLCTRHVRPFAGAAAGIVALSALAGVVSDHTDALHTALVLGTVLVIALGLVPRAALALSGVFRLDAAVTDGRRILRHQARRAIEEAHWAMTTIVVVLAAALAVVARTLATAPALRGWQLATALLLALAWLLRSRHLPLVVERLATLLALAALGAGIALPVLGERRDLAPTVAAVTAVAAVVLALWHLVPLSDYARALAGRWADRVEAAAVTALVPVLAGSFGLYADLLRTFS